MRATTSANAYNALLGLLVIVAAFLGFPPLVEAIIFIILGVLIIIFALASSNFGQTHDSKDSEKR